MAADSAREQNQKGTIKVFLKRSDAIGPNPKYDILEPAKATSHEHIPTLEPIAPAVELASTFLRLWATRLQHGIALRPQPQWEKGDRPYGNLVNYKLPTMQYRFYYVEEKDRALVVIPMLNGNIAVCYRIDKAANDFCIDYIVPELGFKHKYLGTRGDSSTDRNLVMAALTDLYDKISEPPTFNPLF